MEFIVYAPVWGQSGFEHLSRNLLIALDQMGVTIELRPATEFNAERLALSPATISRLQRMVNTRVNPIAPHIIYQLPRGQAIHPSAPVICYTLFETDRCPISWLDSLQKMDKIFVFSEFNRKAWVDSGIEERKIEALPFAVNSFIYNPDGPKMQIGNKKGFTFMCSGDFTERKNFEAVIEAYVKEFSDRDAVTLLFKCHYGGFSKSYRRQCIERLRNIALMFNPKNPPRILFYGDKISEFGMASLYRSADCFVLTSRGEGLGMQYLEAVASGLPVIACDWGAQTDYLTAENSYPVNSFLKVIDDPHYIVKCPQALNSRWCQVYVEDLRAAMRHVFDNRDEANARAQENLKWIRDKTWNGMAIALIKGVIHMFDQKHAGVAA